MRLARTLIALAAFGCAAKQSPVVRVPPAPRPAPAPEPAVDTAKAEAETRAAADKKAMEIALSLGLGTFDVQWAPSRRLFAVAPRVAGKSRILVYADNGERLSDFDVVGSAPPTDFAFLGDGRLVYQGNAPAPRAHKAAGRKKAPRPAPRRVWVVQAVTPAAPARLCDPARAIFSKDRQHLAHVESTGDGEWVGVDGVQVWPRTGVSVVQGMPAWSDDGHSLAMVETPARMDPRLVVLVETDNPTGDTTWPLPPTARNPSLRVFWAGPGVVTVGESATKPSFSADFKRDEAPRPLDRGGSS